MNPHPSPTPEPNEYVVVSNGRTKNVLLVKNIVRCESRRTYTVFYMKNGAEYVASRNLKVVAEELPAELFYRVHKSHMVNFREITTYANGRAGAVLMSDGVVVEVSQRKKNSFSQGVGGIQSREGRMSEALTYSPAITEEDRFAINLRAQGFKWKDIADLLGITTTRLYMRIRGLKEYNGGILLQGATIQKMEGRIINAENPNATSSDRMTFILGLAAGLSYPSEYKKKNRAWELD